MGRSGVVEDFVNIIPGRGIEDVGVAFDLALGKYREEFVRGLVGSWAEVETM